jgi:hypothetical protein
MIFVFHEPYFLILFYEKMKTQGSDFVDCLVAWNALVLVRIEIFLY